MSDDGSGVLSGGIALMQRIGYFKKEVLIREVAVRYHRPICIFSSILIAGVISIAAPPAGTVTAAAAIKLSSTAFNEGALIPVKYTCDGEDNSPPLAWSGAPAGTKCFALICDDPDAPGGTWVHWVMYNIPCFAAKLPEKVSISDSLADGTRQGVSDFGRHGYGGPCPPGGTHRYFFRLYALDMVLAHSSDKLTKANLLKAMEGHVLGQAQLVGMYRR